MALKITKEIGTDAGITSEAYVRIVNYNINKSGIAHFSLQTFMSQADVPALYVNGPGNSGAVKNNAIGETFEVLLQEEVIETYTTMKPVQKEVQIEESIVSINEEGETVTELVTKTINQTVMEEVEETRTVYVPDLTLLEGIDIFEFAYGKLSEKLSLEFGESYVVDC
jgi:hypothetical protein